MVYETRKNKQIALTLYNCNKFTEKVVITRHIHIKTNIERDASLLPLSTVHTANRKKNASLFSPVSDSPVEVEGEHCSSAAHSLFEHTFFCAGQIWNWSYWRLTQCMRFVVGRIAKALIRRYLHYYFTSLSIAVFLFSKMSTPKGRQPHRKGSSLWMEYYAL